MRLTKSTARVVVALGTSLGAAAAAGCAAPSGQSTHAKNVILFLGDAGGIPTLSAASIHAYGEPRRLYIQSMPNIARAETSAATQWVTDSAAGMTAIVTGRKTHNGVIAQSESAVRGKSDGQPLKTSLEYAEEHGRSTGVVSNSSVLSATPAACYAHVNDRKNEKDIFTFLLKPRFGDGVDVVIGAGREGVVAAAKASGLDAHEALRSAGFDVFDTLDAIPGSTRRVALLLSGEVDIEAATQKAIDVLARNPKGFFLLVESDLHTEELRRGLERAVRFDNAIKQTAERMGTNTLMLYTADHSYDFRLHSGRRGTPLLPAVAEDFGNDQDSVRLDYIRRDDDHTGEEVLVAAKGPGADRVRGVLSNVDVFDIMRAAYGWR